MTNVNKCDVINDVTFLLIAWLKGAHWPVAWGYSFMTKQTKQTFVCFICFVMNCDVSQIPLQ